MTISAPLHARARSFPYARLTLFATPDGLPHRFPRILLGCRVNCADNKKHSAPGASEDPRLNVHVSPGKVARGIHRQHVTPANQEVNA